jgi:endonuclease-3
MLGKTPPLGDYIVSRRQAIAKIRGSRDDEFMRSSDQARGKQPLLNNPMKKESITRIFEIFSKRDPSPKTELEYSSPFTLLVAVVLSAQSTDIGVNKATKALFATYDTPEKIFALGEAGLKQYIKTIGLFNTKAKNVIALSELLIKDYASQVPDTIEELIKLPGVGRKTANVVLCSAFGKAAMPVDTHVARVSTRTGLSKGKNPEQIEKDLMEVIPEKWLYNAHHWLVLHGRYVCVARKPKCEICPISAYCEYYSNNNSEVL